MDKGVAGRNAGAVSDKSLEEWGGARQSPARTGEGAGSSRKRLPPVQGSQLWHPRHSDLLLVLSPAHHGQTGAGSKAGRDRPKPMVSWAGPGRCVGVPSGIGYRTGLVVPGFAEIQWQSDL